MRLLTSLIALVLCMGIQSKLVVYGPQELIDEFKIGKLPENQKPVINANYANFGHIPYGQQFIGNIFFDKNNEDQCKKSDSTVLQDAPEVTPYEIIDLVQELVQGRLSTFAKIMIARRGNCTFVDKARNAERAGASLLVVVDSRVENVTNVIMGDDGTGTGIRIPAMIVGKTDGETLIQFANSEKGQEVVLSAEFAVKERTQVAEVEIWYSSNSQRALDFIKEFDRYAHQLKDSVTIKPRFVTWSCPACTDQFKTDECVSNGMYCAPNHSTNDFNKIKGVDIISEDLRQSCLHDILSKKDNEPMWWDYIKEVNMECFGFISEKCSKNAHQALGLDFAETNKCVKESYMGTDTKTVGNVRLEANAQAWKDYGTLYWPSVTINKMTFRGTITAENILEDICANLLNKPKVCIDFVKAENIVYENINIQGDGVVSAHVVVIVIIVLIGANALLIVAYRKCVKKEMEDTMSFKVSDAVSQYVSVAQLDRANHSNTSLEVEQ